MTNFLLLLLFFSPSIFGQQCPDPTYQVNSMKPSFGGISTFYNIAKGISDGLQSTPNNKTYQDINALIGDGPVSAADVTKDLILNQIGAIIFWSFGFVLVLAAIVLFVVTAIWQCCCSCKPKGQNSKFTGFIYLVFHGIILAFLITGLVLFNISTDQLLSSINNGIDYADEIVNDVSNVLVGGSNQLTCVLNDTTTSAFSNMQISLGSYSNNVIGGVKNQTGLAYIDSVDTPNFERLNKETDAAGIQLLDLLQGTSCESNYSTQVQKVTENLKILNEIVLGVPSSEDHIQLDNKLDNIQNKIQNAADEAAHQINTSQVDITSSTDSITSMITDLQDDINNTINPLKRAQLDIIQSQAYKNITLALRLLVILPAAFAIIFSSLAIIAILLELFFKPNWFKTIFLIVSFYIAIILAIITLLISSTAFVGGWAMSAICVPVFEDPDYKLFRIFTNTIPAMTGTDADNFNVGAALQSCNSDSETLYSAINGTQIFSADSILGQLNVASYQKQANDQIMGMGGVTIDNPPDLNGPLKNLLYAQAALNASSLNDCGVGQNVTDTLTDYLKKLTISVQQSQDYTDNYNKLVQSAPNLNNITVEQNNIAFDQGQQQLNGTVDSFISQLQTNVFRCQPLVQIFNNCGYVACDQFAKPIHGLWAAVGLTGLFIFFLAILLLLTYRWIEKGRSLKASSKKPKNKGLRRLNPSAENTDGEAVDDIFAKPRIQSPTNIQSPTSIQSPTNTQSPTNNETRIPRVQVFPEATIEYAQTPTRYGFNSAENDLWVTEEPDNRGTTSQRGLRRY